MKESSSSTPSVKDLNYLAAPKEFDRLWETDQVGYSRARMDKIVAAIESFERDLAEQHNTALPAEFAAKESEFADLRPDTHYGVLAAAGDHAGGHVPDYIQ
jgi:hypothetical protein